MKCTACDLRAKARGLCRKHYYRATSTRPARATRDMSTDERFDFYVDKTVGCWLWTGATFGPDRYGAFGLNGKTMGAHVYAFTRAGGIIGPGEYVLHECDTPRCVNPAHLRAGPPRANTLDMMAKGRGRWLQGSANPAAKLSDEDVAAILTLRGALSQTAIAARFGVTQSHISRLLAGHKRGRAEVHAAAHAAPRT